MNLTAEQVREWFVYDPVTGSLTWRKSRPRSGNEGEVAGCVKGRGNKKSAYRHVSIKGRKYLVHRIAWVYVYGVLPDADIDHIDGDGLNNSLANLRLASRSENNRNRGAQCNSKSGLKGVSWHGGHAKWQAAIRAGGKDKHLGYYKSAEEAHQAYCAAATKLHGEFARAK